jgi:type I restriction enzyme S subunit
MKTINLQPISKNAKVISGFAFKSQEFMDIGIPVIKITNVKKESVTLEDCQFVDRKYLSLNDKYKINNGDVLIALTGSHLSQPNSVVGRVARYHYDEMALLNQRVGKFIILGKNNLDLIFLYYYLVQDKILYSIALNAKGSANQANISPSDVERILIPAFTLSSQRVIADILSAYDDLIDTNRRRIQLLEESARLLFREWFVYFKFPNHKKVKIVDGVPEGWKKEKLIKIGYLNYGKALVEETREEGDVKVYGSSGVVGVHSKSLVEGPGIIVGRKGNVGAVHWVNDSYWPIDTVYYIKREQSNLFLYLSLKIIGFINTDASVPGLNRDYAHSKTILVPTKDFLDKFLNQVNDIYSMVKVLTIQNQKLAQIRDFLLPRLMSGAIEV